MTEIYISEIMMVVNNIQIPSDDRGSRLVYCGRAHSVRSNVMLGDHVEEESPLSFALTMPSFPWHSWSPDNSIS